MDQPASPASPATPTPEGPWEIPVGAQTIALPPTVAAMLAALPVDARPDLIATRVWFERKRGQFLLHLGDVEAGSLDE
jgi:hypothetical protein